MTAEEILTKYSKYYGHIEGNPRAIVKASEAVEAMKEYSKLLLEEYTNRIVENTKTKCLNMETFDTENKSSCPECEYHITDKESIKSQLPKFIKEKGL